MLKKRLGIEAIESDQNWSSVRPIVLKLLFKIPSTLIIPKGCKRIGKSAFSNCKVLKEVVISRSVKSIGGCAFSGCWNIKKVEIPGSVERIDDYAFYGCSCANIEIMTSERKFKSLGRHALMDCLTVRYVKKETRN